MGRVQGQAVVLVVLVEEQGLHEQGRCHQPEDACIKRTAMGPSALKEYLL